jgi:fatty acid desaturase
MRARLHTKRVISLRPTSAYAGELKPLLPARVFEPARSRLLWVPLHLGVVALSTLALAERWVHGVFAPLVSLVIGCSFAGLAFVAHETLHGAVVRQLALRKLVGWICFLPFVLSPRLWVAWHNRMHHGHANEPGVDPDAYPTLDEHRQSLLVRVSTDCLGIGRGRLRGLTSLCIGFHVHSLHVLLAARRRRYLGPRELALAYVESALGVALWTALAFLLGPATFFFAYVLPALVANACVMGYIFTNHALSPHTAVNDPLANSLSVTVPRCVDFLTLRFGFHVEHHLFPWMSSRHAPLVRDLVRARWPERYQSMPLWKALIAVHVTPRVYEAADTLVDPKTGYRFRTLMARMRDKIRDSVRPSRARLVSPSTPRG